MSELDWISRYVDQLLFRLQYIERPHQGSHRDPTAWLSENTHATRACMLTCEDLMRVRKCWRLEGAEKPPGNRRGPRGTAKEPSGKPPEEPRRPPRNRHRPPEEPSRPQGTAPGLPRNRADRGEPSRPGQDPQLNYLSGKDPYSKLQLGNKSQAKINEHQRRSMNNNYTGVDPKHEGLGNIG
jgi:hypothetical protein